MSDGIKITFYDNWGNQLPSETVSSIGEAKARARMNGAVAFHSGNQDDTDVGYIRLFPDGHFQKVHMGGLNMFLGRKAAGHQRRQQMQIKRMFTDPAFPRTEEERDAEEGEPRTIAVGGDEEDQRSDS